MAGKAFFLQRLNEHVQYLKKMDSRLKGEGDFEGTDHDSCKLGQWINDQGPAEVAALQDPKASEVFESLKEPHKRFHDVGHHALEMKQAGDEAGVKAAMTEMHVLSTTISNKLLELDGMS